MLRQWSAYKVAALVPPGGPAALGRVQTVLTPGECNRVDMCGRNMGQRFFVNTRQSNMVDTCESNRNMSRKCAMPQSFMCVKNRMGATPPPITRRKALIPTQAEQLRRGAPAAKPQFPRRRMGLGLVIRSSTCYGCSLCGGVLICVHRVDAKHHVDAL